MTLRTLAVVLLACAWCQRPSGAFFGADFPAPAPDGPPVRACRRGTYDYVASLRDPDTGTHFCGGVLVAPQWVLTSARCVDTANSATAVPFPEVHLGGTSLDAPFSEVRSPRRVVFHTKYHGRTLSPHNVALLHVEPPVFGICPPALDVGRLEEGEVLQTVGWGRRSPNGPFAQSLTAVVDLTTVECGEGDDDDRGGDRFAGMGCVEVALQGICTGAGGGPMLRQGTDELVGVAVEGEGCQGLGKVSFFVPMRKIRNWLLENIDS